LGVIPDFYWVNDDKHGGKTFAEMEGIIKAQVLRHPVAI
jgi:hypothetical protein